MLGLFKLKKSAVRQALEHSGDVRATWFEWDYENEVLTPILVVEYRYELDPAHPQFQADGLNKIHAIISASETPHRRVRIIPVRTWD